MARTNANLATKVTRLSAFVLMAGLLTPNISAALPCSHFLHKLAFWRKSEAALIGAVKNEDALRVFPTIRSEQISALNQALEQSPLILRYPPSRVNELLPIGHLIYFYEGTIFSLNRIGLKMHRLQDKFARFAIEAMGGDLRLLDYATAFQSENSARNLFFDGPLNKWKLNGGSIVGQTVVLKGTTFYNLKFNARSESTTFFLKPRRQGRQISPPPTSLKSPCLRRKCSEQMERLLNPFEATGMVPSGDDTVAFIEEFKSLGFTFLAQP